VRCYKSVALQSSTRESHGSRYFGWKLEQGVFRYFEHPRHLEPEKALEGKYVIQSEEPDLGPVQAVEAYKELSEVEGSLRQLKDLVEMRPIYHHRPKRIFFFVCHATDCIRRL
jgi:transposase